MATQSTWGSTMKVLFILAALVALTLASDVVTFNLENFNPSIAEGRWFVKFYAPWCGHCKKLAPTWEEFATKSKGTYNVGKVDCTQHGDLCTSFGVRGYPTLKVIENGKYYDYQSARTIDAFEKFIKDGYKKAPSHDVQVSAKSSDSAHVTDAKKENAARSNEGAKVLSEKSFDEETKEGTWLVKFYAPWCGHCKKLAPTWEELANGSGNKFSVAKVDCTVENGLCSRHGISGYPTIKMFKDGKMYSYKGQRTIDAFTKWVDGGYPNADSAVRP